MKAGFLDHPFCVECSYDLSGLELPRPCPACGRVADPVAQAAEAREWFARRSARMKWLVRPRTTPPGLWYVLSDPASVKLARRRVVCCLWLSTDLFSVTIFLLRLANEVRSLFPEPCICVNGLTARQLDLVTLPCCR